MQLSSLFSPFREWYKKCNFTLPVSPSVPLALKCDQLQMLYNTGLFPFLSYCQCPQIGLYHLQSVAGPLKLLSSLSACQMPIRVILLKTQLSCFTLLHKRLCLHLHCLQKKKEPKYHHLASKAITNLVSAYLSRLIPSCPVFLDF